MRGMPGRYRGLSSLKFGWPALGIMALGWGWDAWQLRRAGLFAGHVAVAASFAALWLVFVLLLIAAWDLLIALDDDAENPSLGFGPQRAPSWLRSVLTPIAFVVGLVLGHLYWQ